MVQIQCALTGVSAPPVRCHIIPKGLSIKPRGALHFDISSDRPARRRPGGWYDEVLVSAAGEEIFADLDNYAINLFRRKGFLFSARRDQGTPIDGFEPIHDGLELAGTFVTKDVDAQKVKHFGLSLLWRAAASKIQEFDHIRLSAQALEEIRSAIVGDKALRYWEYPVVVGLFDNAYEWTDRTPTYVKIEGSKFVRWCVNGVIIYVSTRRRLWRSPNLGRLCVGNWPDELRGLVHRYNESHQKRSTEATFVEHVAKFGDPYRDPPHTNGYPKFEFDENGVRVPYRD